MNIIYAIGFGILVGFIAGFMYARKLNAEDEVYLKAMKDWKDNE